MFPDESDPALWKSCIREDPYAVSSASGEKRGLTQPRNPTKARASDSGEMTKNQDADIPHEQRSDINQDLYQLDPNHLKTQDVILVHWYGADDREVQSPSISIPELAILTRVAEPPKLVSESEVARNLSDMHPELWDLHRQLHLHARRVKYHGRICRERDCGNTGPLVVRPVCGGPHSEYLRVPNRSHRLIVALVPEAIPASSPPREKKTSH